MISNSAVEKESSNLSFAFRGGEKLLQFIWQFQYFNRSALTTTAGEKIEIVFPGQLNHNQGPDFLEAQIKIDEMLMAGSVELHLKTSQWEEHGHQNDANYKNVILHVVLEHNEEKHSTVPVLELQSRISNMLLQRYTDLMSASSFIACSNSIKEMDELRWMSWKERLLAERLTRKSKLVFQFLEENNFHWEETFWWTLARNFGMKVNTEAFEAIARSISVNILGKHKHQVIQLEALLLGQSGLLNSKFREDYPKMLQREFRFLRKKYGLKPVHMPIHFLRMRPGNFPTIRLAQLAALIQNSAHLFSRIIEMDSVSEAKKLFDVTANDYWHYHYIMDEISSFKKKMTGKDMIENIIINTVVPMLFTYGLYHKEEKFKTKAIKWLESISAETNSTTRGFIQLGVTNKTSFDSQALIELKTQYCDQRHCLKCAVGNAILKLTT
jgi:hypothetical protein